MAEEKKETIFNSSKCLKFKLDSLSNTLMGAVPSVLNGLSEKVKEARVDQVLTKAFGEIDKLAENALQNFKDLASGKLPEIDLPNINKLTSGLFSDIQSLKDQQLFKEFNNLAGILGNELESFTNFLDRQISCVENDYLKSTEVASVQGNIMNNISEGVKAVSDVQLRDMNLDTPFVDGKKLQERFAAEIATKAKDAQQVVSSQGKSFAEQANTQFATLDSLDALEIAPPDQLKDNLTGITNNLV